MPERYKVYDTADYLKSPEDIAAYINTAIEEGDDTLILQAIGHAVRANRNLSEFSRETGLSRRAASYEKRLICLLL